MRRPPPPLPLSRDIEVAYGLPDQVSPLVRRVVADNPNMFTFTGTGTHLVGGDQVAVVDPGPDLPTTRSTAPPSVTSW